MKIVRDKSVGAGQINDPIALFASELTKYSHDPELMDVALVLGDIAPELDFELKRRKDTNKIVRFDTQEPTRYIWNPEGTAEWADEIVEELSSYDHVITSDPYSHYWRLAKYPDMFPSTSISFLPSGYELHTKKFSHKNLCNRKYDLSYAGRMDVIRGQLDYHKELLNQLALRNSAVVSFTKDDPLVTHPNLSNLEKMNTIGESIICLCHNSSFVANGQIGRWIRLMYSWNEKGLYGHPSFKTIIRACKNEISTKGTIKNLPPNVGINVPQFRYRMFEAAFSRTLILIRDDSQYTDFYFKRNTEYVPYTEDNLSDIIDDVLCNVSKYQQIADNAYNRAVNEYTIDKFITELKKYVC